MSQKYSVGEGLLCGIIGVTSREHNVVPLVIKGLQRLEYRGYDSVGVAVISGGMILYRKGAGELEGHSIYTSGGSMWQNLALSNIRTSFL